MLNDAVSLYLPLALLLLLCGGALWLLPWSTKDLMATDRGLRVLSNILITRIRGWWG